VREFIAGRVYIAGAFRVGLGLVGRKWIQVVYLADGDQAVVGKLPASDLGRIGCFEPIRGYESPAKVAKRLRRGRRRSQATKTAWRIIQAARAAD